MSEPAAKINWWDECVNSDGKIDFNAAADFWCGVLLNYEAGAERMRQSHRKLLTMQLDVEAVDKRELHNSFLFSSEILTAAWERAEKREAGDGQAHPKHLTEVLSNVLGQVEKPTLGITTGFPRLDEQLSGGPQRGELVYLGAWPGIGKTAFVLEIARLSAEAGNKILIASREMMATPLGRRMLSQASRVRAKALRTGRLTAQEAGTAVRVSAVLSTLPIWVMDRFGGVEDIQNVALSLLPTPDLIVVDYLQLLKPPPGIKDRRQQVEAMSKALKVMAQKVKAAVICISSLSRKPKGGAKDAPPELSDLRETGELEFDADIVMFLHRPGDSNECTCIIKKNRDGETGAVDLMFTREYVSFREKAEDEGFSFGPRGER